MALLLDWFFASLRPTGRYGRGGTGAISEQVANPAHTLTMSWITEDAAMLKQFDSSYAGHIDLENVGYGGTPINDRRYPNEQLATALSKAEAMAKLMDRLGYGT